MTVSENSRRRRTCGQAVKCKACGKPLKCQHLSTHPPPCIDTHCDDCDGPPDFICSPRPKP